MEIRRTWLTTNAGHSSYGVALFSAVRLVWLRLGVSGIQEQAYNRRLSSHRDNAGDGKKKSKIRASVASLLLWKFQKSENSYVVVSRVQLVVGGVRHRLTINDDDRLLPLRLRLDLLVPTLFENTLLLLGEHPSLIEILHL